MVALPEAADVAAVTGNVAVTTQSPTSEAVTTPDAVMLHVAAGAALQLTGVPAGTPGALARNCENPPAFSVAGAVTVTTGTGSTTGVTVITVDPVDAWYRLAGSVDAGKVALTVHVPAWVPVTTPVASTEHAPVADQVGDPDTVGFVPAAATVVVDPAAIVEAAGVTVTVGVAGGASTLTVSTSPG